MTSPFKDAIAADIKAVFINGLEFADEHDINGETVLCVIDEDYIGERRARQQGEYAEGVFMKRVAIFVDRADLTLVPVRGELLRLDGKRYPVEDVEDDYGVLLITLEANDA